MTIFHSHSPKTRYYILVLRCLHDIYMYIYMYMYMYIYIHVHCTCIFMYMHISSLVQEFDDYIGLLQSSQPEPEILEV